MKRLTQLITIVAFMLGVMLVVSPSVGAINVFKNSCSGDNAKTQVCKARSADNAGNLVQDVITLLLRIAGIVAVIMIIVGGIRYATSNGDQARVTAAKNTILYSVIGLGVTILSFAIVYFVVQAF